MLTSRLDAYISRYGDFCANDDDDDDDDDDTTDYFTPCACARGNNALQGRLSENYLTQNFIAKNILDTKYLQIFSRDADQCPH